MQALFEKYKLINKKKFYLKDEGTNLFTTTNVLKKIVTCEGLRIQHHLKVFVLVMPFLKLDNTPLLMKM
jgi:hypothetical protein